MPHLFARFAAKATATDREPRGWQLLRPAAASVQALGHHLQGRSESRRARRPTPAHGPHLHLTRSTPVHVPQITKAAAIDTSFEKAPPPPEIEFQPDRPRRPGWLATSRRALVRISAISRAQIRPSQSYVPDACDHRCTATPVANATGCWPSLSVWLPPMAQRRAAQHSTAKTRAQVAFVMIRCTSTARRHGGSGCC